jgi:hypothetical protein
MNVVSSSIHKLHRSSCYRVGRAFRSTLGILYYIGGRKQGKRRGKQSRFYIKLDVVHDWMLLPNDCFVSSFTACRKKRQYYHTRALPTTYQSLKLVKSSPTPHHAARVTHKRNEEISGYFINQRALRY